MNALILIDIQNDYFPGGRMELPGSEEAGRKAGVVLAAARAAKFSVFHVQHFSTRPGAAFFLPDTEGVNIHASVAPLPGEPVIRKNFPNAFRQTDLLKRLREGCINRLFIAGMMTQMCVDTTVRAAADQGFQCTLAHDACAARDLAFDGQTVPAREVQTAFMAALNGLFARIVSAEALCAELRTGSFED
ncbi:MAG: cysteine hydrolase [Candidatus Adiutrix sp.]|jgi:nicotinamidase-related amidase|nr:cysteine hydrolase [Candidatus Adiutrix sp.]